MFMCVQPISFNISGDDSVTPCLIVQSQSQHMLGSYVPQCTEDGKYTAQQCHPGTGYCWCVDENGVEVDNTSRPPYEHPVNCSEGQCHRAVAPSFVQRN